MALSDLLKRRKKIDEKKESTDKVEESVDSGKEKSMKDLYGAGKLAAKGVGEKKSKARKYGSAYCVLVKPIVTEKATKLGSENKYVFEVGQKANKIEVAKAIDEVYGIKPISVNIVKMKGKRLRQGRTAGKRKDWKKAIITLPNGKSIKVYEGV